MTPNIIILGSGFIGTHLARTLASNGSSYQLVSSAECNLTNLDQAQQTLQNCDSNTSLVMTACVTRLRDNSYRGFHQNVLMAENLATFLKSHTVRNVVFLSTVDVYGLLEQGQIIHEDLPMNPDDYYAMSKVVSEFILTKACSARNIPLATLRLTGVYGPGDDGKSTIWKLTQSAIESGVISVYGDGQDERDFITVQDVVKVILCEIATPRHHTVNIATGTSHTILEIAQCIAKTIPCKIELVPVLEENRPKRANIMRFDITRLKTEFPEFTPTDLSEGIRQYLSGFDRYGKHIVLEKEEFWRWKNTL